MLSYYVPDTLVGVRDRKIRKTEWIYLYVTACTQAYIYMEISFTKNYKLDNEGHGNPLA